MSYYPQIERGNIEQRIISLPSEILKALDEATKTKYEFKLKEAKFQDKYDCEYLKNKATSQKATVKDLEAMTNSALFNDKTDIIVEEAKAEYAKNQVEQLRAEYGLLQTNVKLLCTEMETQLYNFKGEKK